jgi:hypothetical protein
MMSMGRFRPSPRFAHRAILVAGILWAGAMTGCLYDEDEEDCEPTPLFCDRSRPHNADLTILVGGGSLQVVNVYSGTAYESGRLVWSGTSGGSIRLPLGDYSATATYVSGGKTVIAVDGDYLDYSETETCSGSCYEEVDGVVDLRLE